LTSTKKATRFRIAFGCSLRFVSSDLFLLSRHREIVPWFESHSQTCFFLKMQKVSEARAPVGERKIRGFLFDEDVLC
jgi:hypothetical protein